MSSVAGDVGLRRSIPYCASKGGVELTKEPALDYDAAGAAVFLASDASAYMTGASVFADGGWTAD